jgi:hypothetical protein
MKPILAVAVLLALAVTSCASTFYTVHAVTGTAPTNDNNAASCSLPEDLWPVTPGKSVTIRCEWWQSATMLRVDSLVVVRGSVFTFQPPSTVPTSTQVTATTYVRDEGGTSCPVSLNQTPAAVTKPPAKPTLSVQ